MRILALDTATHLATVALLEERDGQLIVLAEASASVDSRHGETLLPHLTDVLARASLKPTDLAMIAVGIGPGSFTGVRVGLATAKGLALALKIPLLGVSTLDVVAAGAGDHASLLVLLDAKKGEVFGARYEHERRVGDPFHGPPSAVQADATALVGAGVRDPSFVIPAGASVLDPTLDAPSARVLARLALAQLRREGPSDLGTLVPLYVRSADAVIPPAMAALGAAKDR
jgi:tRNA threonylcarbamoyladenosine biosynthesis protein TsaB